jgi:uncharacterized membrane protein required for colicin V production
MNLNLLLVIMAVVLICMVMDGYKKGMVKSLISLISLLITCVVLFLIGLSSYFDGKIFNVILTILLLAAIGLVHHLLNIVFFSAKMIVKLPIVHSLDKLLGIVVGILETVLIVWTIYAFNIFRDLGTLGQVIVDYTRDSRILTCLYENNYLAYLVEQLGQKLPFFVK